MTNDFNTLQFYYPYLFFMIIIYLLIVLIVKLMKNRYNKPWFIQADFYAKREGIQIEHDLLTPKQKSLRTRYLIASFLVRSSMWIQAAYVFALYNRRHGFTIGEIGVLYGIDALSALMMGPILGSLSDLYGRKKFCLLYCLLVIAYVSLRLTENKSLAYVSQILSGISLSIFHISFESWLNFETGIIFSPDKESRLEKNTYLREIFSMQVMIDCFTSVILSSLGSYLYSKFGIEFPFYVAILFVFLGGVFIFLEWNENDRTLYRMNNAGFIEFEE